MSSSLDGRKISISGIVQGVGFRPFVYTLAARHHLSGRVWNNSTGVVIEAFGVFEDLARFCDDLRSEAPILSRIDHFEAASIDYQEISGFSILPSQTEEGQFLPVSPDMSICPDCLRELFDPKDRRYRYPFINCTNCGPRFSIIRNIPYDRPKTTMADFDLCPACQAEYENPADRRFHAQPIACPQCGPRLQFITQGQIVAKFEGAISTARRFIQEGKIVALKGLGGYHLACDAANAEAVSLLRQRKKRSDRPFALMSYDLDTIRQYCEVSDAEAFQLQTLQRPIVLLHKSETCHLPEQVAPLQQHLGFMLPYTPLHYLLLEPDEDYPGVLVMTSGNLSDEPIAFEDKDALERLDGLADGFLIHNRPIHMRVDDSVLRVVDNQPYPIRRSRGFAPDPIRLGQPMPEMLACGAGLKNTFCLSRDHYAFLSHHIGDLENYETLRSYEEGIAHYEKLFRIQPKSLVADLHPEYLSTKYALERSTRENLPLIQVQHHHAHLAACLADNHRPLDEKVIGLIFDGTGFGTDGNIWGGEILIGSCLNFQRRFHLEETPLPGGDSAIRNPAKIALAHLFSANLPWDDNLAPVMAFTSHEKDLLKKQITSRINCPLTTSMGRLFDAVAALIGLRQTVSYEGQAAIELENLCAPAETWFYQIKHSDETIHTSELISQILDDLQAGVTPSEISGRFHNGLALMCVDLCKTIRRETGIQTVALSGGVWQNITLLNKTTPLLACEGFEVLIHHQVPANDGGIALGQLVVAAANMQKS